MADRFYKDVRQIEGVTYEKTDDPRVIIARPSYQKSSKTIDQFKKEWAEYERMQQQRQDSVVVNLPYYPDKDKDSATLILLNNPYMKLDDGGTLKPNFIKRLEDPNRKSILDWASRSTYRNRYTYDISTHKMGYEYTPDDTGRAIVFPEVQEVNGKLVDFTRPPYHSWAGYDSALDRGDYLIMKNLEEARKWVEGYKDRYKNLK